MKTILLMRHSIPEQLNLPTEQIPLSQEGIRLANTLKDQIHADKCFSSPYTRAYQTACILFDSPIMIQDLHERIIGDAADDFWLKQYTDYSYKNPKGESLYEVKRRMTQAIQLVLENTQEEETVLVISHATAICSYLLNVCNIEVVDSSRKIRRITYQNKVILEGQINPMDYFEIVYEQNEIRNITFKSN